MFQKIALDAFIDEIEKLAVKPDKNAPVGEGGRFESLKERIARKGKVSDPGAVAAAIGRKKYGKSRFQHMAAAGKK